jgi:hypothetical protein
MPVLSNIDKKQGLIVTVGEGVVTFEEIRAHQSRLLGDLDFNPAFNQLIDLTKVTKLELSGDQARTVAMRPIVSQKSRRAYVATSAHIFGLGRMMQIYHQDEVHVSAEVFHSREEALKWLGVNRDPELL